MKLPSKGTCLEWATEAEVIPDDYFSGDVVSLSSRDLEQLIHRAVKYGAESMREEVVHLAKTTSVIQLPHAIRNIKVEEPE